MGFPFFKVRGRHSVNRRYDREYREKIMTGSGSRVTAAAEVELGEVRSLAATLGSPIAALIPAFPTPVTLTTVPAFRAFRDRYLREILATHEWPLIIEAHEFARRGYARELIAADRAWGARMLLAGSCGQGWPGGVFGEASFRVGQRQLNRLRPMRDLRIVQRYLAAIEAGEAQGWHALVFGVVLTAYGLPLRQGLLHFAQQTLAGFFAGAPVSAEMTEPAQAALLAESDGPLVAALNLQLPAWNPEESGRSGV